MGYIITYKHRGISYFYSDLCWSRNIEDAQVFLSYNHTLWLSKQLSVYCNLNMRVIKKD